MLGTTDMFAATTDTLEEKFKLILIAATTTNTGLKVQCGVDETEYKTGIKVSDEDYAGINLVRNEFCGHLNYTIFQQ